MSTTASYSLAARSGPGLPVAVEAHGCEIVTADGRRYLDACGGAMVMSLGHRHPRLVKALRRQADRLTFAYRFTFDNEPDRELSRLLHEIAPMDGAMSFTNSSGSESIESAIHVVLLYWQAMGRPEKSLVIGRRPGFHGSTAAALGLSGSLWRRGVEAMLDKNATVVTPNADIRCGRSEADETAFALADLEREIERRGADRVAAFVLEPIVAASGGAIVPPTGYLAGVRAICDRLGVLVIADETVTGFGRTGTWWGSQYEELRPDIATFAKGVTSGITPFSGLVISGPVAEGAVAADGFGLGHTFSGNPLGSAVACETIRVIREEGLVERAAEAGRRLRTGLDQVTSGRTCVGQVRGVGLLQAIELVRDGETLSPLPGGAALAGRLAADRGVLLYPCRGMLPDCTSEALMMAPPLVIDDSDIDRIVDVVGAVARSLEETAAGS